MTALVGFSLLQAKATSARAMIAIERVSGEAVMGVGVRLLLAAFTGRPFNRRKPKIADVTVVRTCPSSSAVHRSGIPAPNGAAASPNDACEKGPGGGEHRSGANGGGLVQRDPATPGQF